MPNSPLQVTDLLVPEGDLSLALFADSPGDGSPEDWLAAWLADGYVRAAGLPAGPARDDAARWWAYGRAYSKLCDDAASAPIRSDLGGAGGAVQFDVRQGQTWCAKATLYLDRAAAAFAAAVLPPVAELPPTAAADTVVRLY